MQPEYVTPHNGLVARVWEKVYNLMEKNFGMFEKPMKVVESAQRAKRIRIGWHCCCIHSNMLPHQYPLISQANPWPLSRLLIVSQKIPREELGSSE
jgi:hypothetical protein